MPYWPRCPRGLRRRERLMAYPGALHSDSSLRRAASSNSCLPESVRLHQCMCWMRFELHRIPWKEQPGSRDCASSSWLRALAAYSLQLRIGTAPLSPRQESSVFWRSAYSRPRGRAGTHPCTSWRVQRGLRPIADPRNCSRSPSGPGSSPVRRSRRSYRWAADQRLLGRTQMSRAERWRAGERGQLWVSSSLNPLVHQTGGCRRRRPTRA